MSGAGGGSGGAGRGGGRAVCGEENRAGVSEAGGARACGGRRPPTSLLFESCAAEIDPIRLWTISDLFRGVRGSLRHRIRREESGGASAALARRSRWE